MAVSRRLRYEILRRDNHACRYCGATAPDVKLTVDHVVPVALGGSDDPTNLVTACAGCNGGKTSSAPDAPLVADVADDALRWSVALQAAAGRMLADLERCEQSRAEFDLAWSAWNYGDDKKPIPRPGGWRESVDQFMAAGLPMSILLECMRKTMNNQRIGVDDTFRYMCGIAWKRVTELQEAARGDISSEPAADGDPYGAHDLIYDMVSDAEYGELSDLVREYLPDIPEDQFHREVVQTALWRFHNDRYELAAAFNSVRTLLPRDQLAAWVDEYTKRDFAPDLLRILDRAVIQTSPETEVPA